jgi:flagellar biosynthesis protein FliP
MMRRLAAAGLGIGIAAALPPAAALAQSLSLDLGETGGSSTAQIVQIFALLTVLSLAPSILIMVTSFIRIVVVLSFLRTAMGVQQTPPNTVMVSLALFLTFFVMAPVLQQSYAQGIVPLINEEVEPFEGFERAAAPVHAFMMRHVREADLILFADMAQIGPVAEPQDTPLHVLIPAFMISELRRAFEIGFLMFLPFLIIDMVVASILMSMGMMMLPPAMIAMPFKIIFFVLVDGWHLIAGTLVQSFGTLPG